MSEFKSYFNLYILLTLVCFTEAFEDQRFSDFKRCADEECSMLLCRGKASQDFSGPDCRFLSFKTGETIFVYYKLSGHRSNVWAGSVGNSFGYFPKDYLNINHIYTEKEFEVAAEATDFVCFDTGHDKFESYDVDVLLGNSLNADDKTEEVSHGEDPATDCCEAEEIDSELSRIGSEDDNRYGGELQDPELTKLPSESTASSEKDGGFGDTNEGADVEKVVPGELKKKTDSTTHVEGFSKLETTLGETFDAVASDEENTQKVTPHDDDDDDDDQSKHLAEQPVEVEEETMKKPLLLTFHEKPLYPEEDVPEAAESEDKQVSFQREETSHGGKAAKDEETRETVINQLPSETSASPEPTDQKVPDEPSPKDDGNLKNGSDSTTWVEGFSEIKTTFGETFDAVASDDENTLKVTPHDDDNDKDQNINLAEQPVEVVEESMKIPSLLTFEEKPCHFKDNVPDAVDSEHVSFRKEKIPLGDEATEDGETREISMNIRNSDSLHKEDDSGHLQDFVTDQPLLETTHEKIKDSADVQKSSDADPDLEKPTDKDVPVEPSAKDDGFLENKIDSTTLVERVSELKTTLGGTYDAVISDEENTRKVTPHNYDDDNDGYDDDQINNLAEQPIEEEEETMRKSSLHSFEEKDYVPEDRLLPASVEATTDLPEDEDEDEDEEDHIKTTEKDVDKDRIISFHDSRGREREEEKMKPSVNKSVQKTQVLKSNEEEMRSDEIKDKFFDLDETLIDAVESKNASPTSPLEEVLDKPTESFILKPNPGEIEPSASASLLQEHPLSEPELDEQIHRVKNEIIIAFESALKTEKTSEVPEEEVEEEEEHVEELLEDENAILSTKTELTDDEKSTGNTNLEASLEENGLVTPEQADKMNHDEKTQTDNSVSTADSESGRPSDRSGAGHVLGDEPEYSDSVRRLTLLRDRFKDDEIERLMRHLSIKDLYKVEAMFTDLDHQLNSAKQLHPQSAEELEHALERILEISENAILYEVDRMLDAQEQRAQELGRQIDQVVIDEGATILDDFQEFAFYLRQKYSASVPLVKESEPRWETAENVSKESETVPSSEVSKTPEIPHETGKLFTGQEAESRSQDVGPGKDAGHFNKNEDNQALQDSPDGPRGPQALLENPLDVLGFEIRPSSDSPDSSTSSDFSDKNTNHGRASMSASDHAQDFFLLAEELLGVYAEMLISALPEEWRPGPTFHGLPWKSVVATAVVGLLTVLVVMWRSVLSVKSRMYLLTEKQLTERIQQLIKDKSDVLNRITELNSEIKQYEEKLNNSRESRSSLQKEFNGFKTHYQDLKVQKEKLSVNFTQLNEKIAKTQNENKTLTEKVSTVHQGIENYQKTLKVYDEERAKVLVLMDEAKLREDAMKAQVLSFEKDNSALKEQKKSLLKDAKDWQEKHEKLSEEIKVYHKTQTELENALVHKENEIDVLSGCIAELKSLESCDAAEMKIDKNGDPVKLHLKQMMDVSRIKMTLSVIEDERNRLFENFMAEQKARQELEEKFQKVIHDQTNLKNERTHLENQYKNLQQRLEITTELYHQNENILHQKLTQEELERHEKESKLSEVDGRAVEAEEELNCLKQKVKDVQEEMQQNERTLKTEIAVQEKKAHENWLKARASERALIEERRECANLRQKIVECSDKMSDLEHTLYKSGPPDRHMPPVQRGESYGPSPVSGGAPSPPLMIEDPGRPPSGPLGRRGEPYGQRRSADLGHPLPFRPELSVPRTSSPCTQDGSVPKSQRQGPFLPSPIRESPVPMPKAYGPRAVGGPLPPGMRPPNAHSPMIPPGPSFGPEPPFRPPHMDPYRPPFPLRPYGPIPPPYVHGPPRRDFPSMGPHPPHDFPPNFAAPQDPPSRPWLVPSGPLLPPGTMVPPVAGTHGLALSSPPQPRETQEMRHAPPEHMVAQNAPTPAGKES